MLVLILSATDSQGKVLVLSQFRIYSAQNPSIFCSLPLTPVQGHGGTGAPSHAHLVRLRQKYTFYSPVTHTRIGGVLSSHPIVHVCGLWKETQVPRKKLTQTGKNENSMQNLCSTNRSTTPLPLLTSPRIIGTYSRKGNTEWAAQLRFILI